MNQKQGAIFGCILCFIGNKNNFLGIENYVFQTYSAFNI